jgi:O-antigen ligase
VLDAHHLWLIGPAAATIAFWGLLTFSRLLALREERPQAAPRTLLWLIGVGPVALVLVTPRSYLVSFDPQAVALTSGLGTLTGQILTLATIAMSVTIFLIEATRPTEHRTGRGLVTALILFYATVIVSAELAGHGGLNRGLFIAPLVIAAFYIAPRIPPTTLVRDARRILRVYIWGSLVAVLVAHSWATFRVQNFQTSYSERDYFGFGQLLGLTPHPNALGPVAAVALLFELARFDRGKWWRCNAAAATAVLLLSQSRTAWGAALVGLVFLRPRKGSALSSGRVVTASFAVAIAGILLMFPSNMQAVSNVAAEQNVSTLGGRELVWTYTLHEFQQSTLIGYGPTLFSPQYRGGALPNWAGQAHNQLLQSMGETGVLGLAAVLVMVVCLVAGGRRARHETSGLSIALVVMLLVRAVSETPLRNRGVDSELLLVVLTVLMTAMVDVRPAEDEQTPDRERVFAAG